MKIDIESPLAVLGLPDKVMELFTEANKVKPGRFETIWDVYCNDVRCFRLVYRSKGLLELPGFGEAAYKIVCRRLKAVGLPDISEALSLIAESHRAFETAVFQNEGGSSG
jgi:hypothetical protein